jgi:hypothetical protein
MIGILRLQSIIPSLSQLSPDAVMDLERRAVAFIESQTDRYFGVPESTVEYLQGTDGHALRLAGIAVEQDSDDEVTVTERCCRGTAAVSLSSSAFDVRQNRYETVLVRIDGRRWRRGTEYAATYSRGYRQDCGPADIEQAIIDLIALRVNLRGKEGLSGETIGGYSWTKSATYNFTDGELRAVPGLLSTIGAWKRPVMA